MACDELNAFRTATESLDQRIYQYPGMGRARFWQDAIPKGTFVKGQGVTRTTFTMKPSEPTDDPTSWTDITLDGDTDQPTPACDTDYEDVGVGFYARTYNPKKVRLRGPVICKENLTFQHNVGAFLDGYVREMARYSSRKMEFALRADYMYFADWFSDYEKFSGPNARPTVTLPTSDIMQDALDDIAQDLIDTGVGTDERGYVTEGEEGKIFPLYIDARDSAKILKTSAERRADARWQGTEQGNLSLWKPIGATRTIGNFRHISTNIAPRFNNVGGVLTPVNPFINVDDITSNGQVISPAYKAARYRAAIVVVPSAMTAEIVTPYNWKFPDTQNYNGIWNFITGGERICTPAVYDPEHEKGRHFAKFEYAPRPDMPFHAKVYVYKHCPSDEEVSVCESYT